MFGIIPSSRRLAGALLVGLFLVGADTASAHKTQAPTWVTTKGKIVTLTLIAGYNNTAASGFNFNGGANGKMVVTVPLGDTVNVVFSNNAPLPHSAQFVAFSKTPPAAAVPDAFKGAHSPNPTAGVGKGTTQKFSFTANKAGNYLLICAVPGHAAAGMWDLLTVSSSAKAASVVIK